MGCEFNPIHFGVEQTRSLNIVGSRPSPEREIRPHQTRLRLVFWDEVIEFDLPPEPSRWRLFLQAAWNEAEALAGEAIRTVAALTVLFSIVAALVFIKHHSSMHLQVGHISCGW